MQAAAKNRQHAAAPDLPPHHLVAIFFQKFSRLSSPPNRVVKIVESASRMSPARVPGGRHPKKHIELFVSRLDERMRPGDVDRLPGQHVDRLWVVRGDRIVRQMHMEVEGRNAGEPSSRVQILDRGERNKPVRPWNRGRAETLTVFDRNAESLDERSRVPAEALLPGNQGIAVVRVLHGALFQIGGDCPHRGADQG